MLKRYVNSLLLFICSATILMMCGCKSAVVPKPLVVSVREKVQGKTAASVTTSSKTAIGTQLGGSRQGVPLNLGNMVSTFAGKAGLAGMQDGSETEAGFDAPKGITTDGFHLYLADSNSHTIRKIDIGTGMVTTLAGMAGKKGSIDGKGVLARFNRPYGMTTDGSNLYVTDSNNHTIRQIDTDTGMVTTIAGAAGKVGYVDGIGKRARFFIPEGITIAGNYLYVSDTHNHSVRKISLESHAVTTIAGLSGAPGFFDAIGSKARFSSPKGITSDGHYLYVADFGNSQIRKVSIRSGSVNTLAGMIKSDENPAGQMEVAHFNYPTGITTDGHNLYVADTFNRSVRKISISTAIVTAIAGAGEKEVSVDGIGFEAYFKDPVGITTDGKSLFVTDPSDHIVRKIR